MAESFSYKLTNENELFAFDFGQVLAYNETISTATSSIIVMDGVDASPFSMLIGSPAITNTKVNQRLSGGISEVTYRLIITITTSQGNVVTAVGDLPVYANNLV